MASTYAWFSRCSVKICWASSNDIRTRVYQCLSYARSRNRFYSDWITCTVAAALSTLVRITPASRFSISSRTDLKPENVLIAIDDVESIISAELAASLGRAPILQTQTIPASPLVTPTLPQRPRARSSAFLHRKVAAGTRQPRSESVFITGSQPLPSPSSSFVSSPGLDRWAFKMSKIEADEPKKDDDGAITMKMGKKDDRDIVAEVGAVSLDTRAGYVGRAAPDKPPPTTAVGPSLLSQLAPSAASGSKPMSVPARKSLDVPSIQETPSSVMSVDRESTSSGSGEVYIDQQEKITVKIADLGNGACSLPFPPSLLYLFYLFPVACRASGCSCALFWISRTRCLSNFTGFFHEGLPFREPALDSSGGAALVAHVNCEWGGLGWGCTSSLYMTIGTGSGAILRYHWCMSFLAIMKCLVAPFLSFLDVMIWRHLALSFADFCLSTYLQYVFIRC